MVGFMPGLGREENENLFSLLSMLSNGQLSNRSVVLEGIDLRIQSCTFVCMKFDT